MKNGHFVYILFAQGVPCSLFYSLVMFLHCLFCKVVEALQKTMYLLIFNIRFLKCFCLGFHKQTQIRIQE